MNTFSVIINGQTVEAFSGETILEVVRRLNLDEIPTLCHSEELEPYGSCFVCVVEVKGRPTLVPSCATRVTPGMEIQTRNERVIESRKTALELLLSNHYADCVSPCLLGCPANVDVQGYIALAAMGQEVDAVELIRESNPLPAVCGRICVRKCEVSCRRVDVDTAVGINAIKRYVTDADGVYDVVPHREASKGKSIGIVGSGPAGLTAAWFLGKKGYDPVIYEANEKTGGMLRYGIPSYRLPDEVIDKEVAHIEAAGVKILLNTRVGQEISLEELRRRHEAIFIAAGAMKGKPMRVPHENETEGVIRGAEFLADKTRDPSPVAGTVVVIGGGNTAMDVARTSWRLGAEKVIILYRRTKAEMPADKMEIDDCLEEGVEIIEQVAPLEIIADENGKLKALKCIRIKLGEPDSSGRRRPVPMEGSEFEVSCDIAIPAIGQDSDLSGLVDLNGQELKLTRWNTISIDTNSMSTNIPGVFAGGDSADNGPTVVIDAIGDGKKAATAIHTYLSGEPYHKPFRVEKAFWAKPGKAELGEVPESPRHEVSLIPVEERKFSFKEVASGFDYEDAMHETARCLSCGCVEYETCDLRLQAEKYDVDMELWKGQVRKHKVDSRHPHIIYDPNKCILCARCIRTCEQVLHISALGLVGRGFKTEMRPSMNDPLFETNCVSCGNCIDACPTGALTPKYTFPGRASLATTNVKTHCGFCSMGCELEVKSFADGRFYIKAGGKPGDYICRFGRFGHELFSSSERIKTPSLRAGMDRVDTDLSLAVSKAVLGLQEVVNKYGPEHVAVLVSSECSNEELYLAGKIASEGLKTRNIGSIPVLAQHKEPDLLDQSFGFTASTNDRQVIKEADLIICNNTNIVDNHLPLSAYVLKAVRKNGAKLIVANSVLSKADNDLGAIVMDPMRGRANVMWKAVFDAVSGMEVETDFAGVDKALITQTAKLINESKRVVFIHSADRQYDAAPDDIKVLANLVSIHPHADLLLVSSTSNSAGLSVVGADCVFGPGRVKLPEGKSRGELLRLLEDGSIRAALIIGEDPMKYDWTSSMFKNIEFLVAMDWAWTETTRYADVVLPGSTFLESNGTRCNFEGRLIDYKAAVSPAAGVSGWVVLRKLAQKFGIQVPSDFDSIHNEMDAGVKAGLKELVGAFWSKGEPRPVIEKQVVDVDVHSSTPKILPPMTASQQYKEDVRKNG